MQIYKVNLQNINSNLFAQQAKQKSEISFANPIAFTGKDKVEISKGKSLYGNLSQKEVAEILEAIKDERNLISDKGTTAKVYRYKDYAIKVPKDKNTKNLQLKTMNDKQVYDFYLKKFIMTNSALKYLEKINLADAQRGIDIINTSKFPIQVSTFIDGEPVDTAEKKLNKEMLEDIVKKLTILDQNGLIHQDIFITNFLFKNDKAGIIDLDEYDILNNEKKVYETMIVPQNYKQNMNGLIFDFNVLKKPLKRQIASLPFNPFVTKLSNLDNFEHHFLFLYLTKLIKENQEDYARKILKDYLPLKAEFYHKKMLKDIENINEKDLTEDEIWHKKKGLEIEKLQAELFKEKNELIEECEFNKIMMCGYLRLAVLFNDNKAFGLFKENFDKLNEIVSRQESSNLVKNYLNIMKIYLGTLEELVNATFKDSKKLSHEERLRNSEMAFDRIQKSYKLLKN